MALVDSPQLGQQICVDEEQDAIEDFSQPEPADTLPADFEETCPAEDAAEEARRVAADSSVSPSSKGRTLSEALSGFSARRDSVEEPTFKDAAPELAAPSPGTPTGTSDWSSARLDLPSGALSAPGITAPLEADTQPASPGAAAAAATDAAAIEVPGDGDEAVAQEEVLSEFTCLEDGDGTLTGGPSLPQVLGAEIAVDSEDELVDPLEERLPAEDWEASTTCPQRRALWEKVRTRSIRREAAELRSLKPNIPSITRLMKLHPDLETKGATATELVALATTLLTREVAKTAARTKHGFAVTLTDVKNVCGQYKELQFLQPLDVTMDPSAARFRDALPDADEKKAASAPLPGQPLLSSNMFAKSKSNDMLANSTSSDMLAKSKATELAQDAETSSAHAKPTKRKTDAPPTSPEKSRRKSDGGKTPPAVAAKAKAVPQKKQEAPKSNPLARFGMAKRGVVDADGP